MRRTLLPAVALVSIAMLELVACRSIWGFEELSKGEPDTEAGALDPDSRNPPIDAPQSATVCSVRAPFDPPTALASLNSAADEIAPRLADDELTIFYTTTRNGGSEVFEAKRPSLTASFDAPRTLFLLSPGTGDPMITSDGLRLYVTSSVLGPSLDVASATRSSPSEAFGPLASVGALVNSTSAADFQPFESPMGLWFVTDRASRREIWFASGVAGSFASAQRPEGLFAEGDEGWPTATADGLALYIESSRSGKDSIWVAERSSPNAPFDIPTLVGELDSAKSDVPGWLSPDRCRLYFFSDRDGSFDLFVATRRPPPN